MDDEPLVRTIVASFLQEIGFQVIALDCGDAAWKLIEGNFSFDLLITDVRMPGKIDGIELAQRVKARFPNFGILIMSGYVGGRYPAENGFSNFLQKPFTVSQLSTIIRRLISSDTRMDSQEVS